MLLSYQMKKPLPTWYMICIVWLSTHQRLKNIDIFSEISIENREITQEVNTIHLIYILQIFYFSIFIHSYLAWNMCATTFIHNWNDDNQMIAAIGQILQPIQRQHYEK